MKTPNLSKLTSSNESSIINDLLYEFLHLPEERRMDSERLKVSFTIHYLVKSLFTMSYAVSKTVSHPVL